jgi:DNA-binding NarL/FixJ family response regulator
MQTVEILIADQYEFSRRMLRSVIGSHHPWHVCDEAADGIEAVEKAKRLDPKIVVMQSKMPRMDGVRAAQQIRRELPDTRIVLISDSAEFPSVQPGEPGADEFVSKETVTGDITKFLAVLKRASQTENAREYGLDRTLEETFPCSDPLSSIPNPSFRRAEVSTV